VIDVKLGAIRGRLKDRHATRYAGEAHRWAAVAAVLRPMVGLSGELQPLETEVLLIRRADRQGDPWSGQMAFPGGHREPGDADMLATAMRETLEEVGLDLSQHELIGALDEHPATYQGTFTGMVIAPFVFALKSDVELTPNREVASVIWAPLGQMARGELNVQHALQRNGETMHFPAFGIGPHVVWGLTHRMLQNLFESLSAGGTQR
jgi:8-oxo-dGTP pyrophosphatase MutT (NUDIX family)